MTSPDQNKHVILRVFREIVNGADYDLMPELYHERFVDHDPVPGAPEGLAAATYSIEALRRAIPDLHASVQDISAHADTVVIHVTWRGKQTGSLVRLMPPSGRDVNFTGIVIWRFADGKIAERWAMIDKDTLARQTGARAPGKRAAALPHPAPG